MKIIERIKLEVQELILQLKEFSLNRKLIKVNNLLDHVPLPSMTVQLTAIQKSIEDEIKQVEDKGNNVTNKIIQLKVDSLIKKFLK